MKLADRAHSVKSRDDLAAFIAALREDLDVNAAGWENPDLPSFLDAMAAWTHDMDGFYANTGESISELSPWAILAHMFMAARTYE